MIPLGYFEILHRSDETDFGVQSGWYSEDSASGVEL